MKLAYAIWPWGLNKKEEMIQGIKDIKEIGFQYFESVVSAVDLYENQVGEFRAVMQEYEVYPVSFYFWQNGEEEHDVQGVQRVMEFLAANGVHRMSIQAPSKHGGATRSELDYVLKVLDKIGKITKRNGIMPCVHPHHGTMVMYENEIDYIMQNTDPELISLCPDTAHLTVGKCNPVEIVGRYADRVRFVHLKDIKKSTEVMALDEPGKGFDVYSSFVELGHGDVDFKGVLRILKKASYDGYLTIELDRSRFGNKESATMNYKSILELLAKIDQAE